MNLSRLFILRPVATTLSMLAIVLAGIISYRLLPVSALPQVDYPTIRVMTLYPGASPDVMTSAVTAPLERQFGQMPGLTQMASTSSGGASVLTLRFNLDINMDVAEQQVQAAINAATNLLPKDLPAPPVYNKVNPADTPVLTLAITSKTMLLPKLNDLADTRMAQKIAQISGVGMVSIAGGQRQAVRIKVNPEALAANGLNLSDVRTLIAASNVNQPKGNFDGPTRVSMLDANDQLVSPAQYAELILAYNNGAPLRLKDVAQIVDGAENERLAAWANENQAVLLNIQRQPGANVIEVVDRIKALLPSITDNLPAGLDVTVLTDRTQTIRASVKDVQHELLIAIATGGDGDVPVPAQGQRHAHSVHRRAAVAGGHLWRDVPGGFLHQQPHADGLDHRHRFRGGRCHRDAGEHLALYRGGRNALGRGAKGRQANRFYPDFPDPVADRGIDSAAVHGRRRRAPVP